MKLSLKENKLKNVKKYDFENYKKQFNFSEQSSNHTLVNKIVFRCTKKGLECQIYPCKQH